VGDRARDRRRYRQRDGEEKKSKYARKAIKEKGNEGRKYK